MRHAIPLLFLLASILGSTPLTAQGFDPARQATGWAYQEVDGSLTFYDPAARSLRTWLKGAGLLANRTVSLPETRKPAAPRPSRPALAETTSDYDAAGALLYGTAPVRKRLREDSSPAPVPAEICDALPERWVVDAYNRVWMACDGHLAALGKDGKPDLTLDLVAPVEDLAVGPDGLYILFRTLRPYLEKRDVRTGALLWSFGEKVALKEAAAQPLRVPLNRMAIGTDGAVYLAEGASLAFTVLDPARGPKDPGQSFFTCQGALPSRPVLGRWGRGPVLAWAGREVLFSAFSPSQVRDCGAPESKGLLLARFDLAKGTLEWLPTPLGDGHQLVGLLDHEAVFLKPGGGLAFAPIR